MNIKQKKKRVEKAKNSLVKSAEDYAEKAESTGKLELISESNIMQRTAKQKESEIEMQSNLSCLNLRTSEFCTICSNYNILTCVIYNSSEEKF